MLLVAGPSAVGKSTFMRCLREGRLPSAIRVELPGGCESWSHVHAFEIEQFLNGADGRGETDIVLHYDLMRSPLCGFSTLLEDPSLAVVARVGTIIAVTLRASPDRLWYQLARRFFGGDAPAETRAIVRRAKTAQMLDAARENAAILLSPMLAGLTGKRAVSKTNSPRLRHLKMLAEYRRRGFTQFLFDRWGDFLDRLAHDGPLIKQIDVAPVGDVYAENEQGWKLLGASARARNEGLAAASTP